MLPCRTDDFVKEIRQRQLPAAAEAEAAEEEKQEISLLWAEAKELQRSWMAVKYPSPLQKGNKGKRMFEGKCRKDQNSLDPFFFLQSLISVCQRISVRSGATEEIGKNLGIVMSNVTLLLHGWWIKSNGKIMPPSWMFEGKCRKDQNSLYTFFFLQSLIFVCQRISVRSGATKEISSNLALILSNIMLLLHERWLKWREKTPSIFNVWRQMLQGPK